jgi:hypothetical protein
MTSPREKGGYSPPERVYDLSSLPNAPAGPAPGARPEQGRRTMTTCTKNVNAPCENEAIEVLWVRAPGGPLETYYRCADHPAAHDVKMIKFMSRLAAVKIERLAPSSDREDSR